MLIFDLFSGTNSATQPFIDAGYTVISFEIDGNFHATGIGIVCIQYNRIRAFLG